MYKEKLQRFQNYKKLKKKNQKTIKHTYKGQQNL